ncbi:hypothetical protein N9997_03150 [Synechococcus sp. AH-603-L18]|nr:hypothetical protein [Synechococcus sp. AH-603-L18]
MWQKQPNYAKYKEKSNGEDWLVNRQEGTLVSIKPDAATQHAHFVLLSCYRLSDRLGQPTKQQRMHDDLKSSENVRTCR